MKKFTGALMGAMVWYITAILSSKLSLGISIFSWEILIISIINGWFIMRGRDDMSYGLYVNPNIIFFNYAVFLLTAIYFVFIKGFPFMDGVIWFSINLILAYIIMLTNTGVMSFYGGVSGARMRAISSEYNREVEEKNALIELEEASPDMFIKALIRLNLKHYPYDYPYGRPLKRYDSYSTFSLNSMKSVMKLIEHEELQISKQAEIENQRLIDAERKQRRDILIARLIIKNPNKIASHLSESEIDGENQLMIKEVKDAEAKRIADAEAKRIADAKAEEAKRIADIMAAERKRQEEKERYQRELREKSIRNLARRNPTSDPSRFTEFAIKAEMDAIEEEQGNKQLQEKRENERRIALEEEQEQRDHYDRQDYNNRVESEKESQRLAANFTLLVNAQRSGREVYVSGNTYMGYTSATGIILELSSEMVGIRYLSTNEDGEKYESMKTFLLRDVTNVKVM